MENEKKTATSSTEMVTISRAEYESQQAQLTELKLQNQWLLEQLGLAKKRQFTFYLCDGIVSAVEMTEPFELRYVYGYDRETGLQYANEKRAELP